MCGFSRRWVKVGSLRNWRSAEGEKTIVYDTGHIPSSFFSFSHEIEPFGSASSNASRASRESCLSSWAFALDGLIVRGGRFGVSFFSFLASVLFGMSEIRRHCNILAITKGATSSLP